MPAYSIRSSEDALHLFISAADKADMGIIMINSAGKIWFWNNWMKRKSGLSSEDASNKSLLTLFAELENSRLLSSVEDALRYGHTSLLSQSLNKSPLPLFPNLPDRNHRLQQSIHIMAITDRHANRNCLLLIHDVSVSVRKEQTLREQAEQLRQYAYIDGLTGIPNRRRFDAYLFDEIKRAARDNTQISLIMLDVDHFKKYNDLYGHQAGDFCLQRIANALKASLQRPADFVARYGGEEFVIVLPATPVNGAALLAENLSIQIEGLAIRHEQSGSAGIITLSIGVTGATPEQQISGAQLIAQADEALYQSKKLGRNRITVYPDLPDPTS